LERAGFDPGAFVVAAYGSDAQTRDELPVIALRRAQALTGERFEGKDVVIVGDTPLDISCGLQIGAKTIAVTTGPYSEEELAPFHPDVILPGFQDTALTVRYILNGRVH